MVRWRMVRWCIRLTRLTLVCEVIRYRLVQVRQNQKKKKKKKKKTEKCTENCAEGTHPRYLARHRTTVKQPTTLQTVWLWSVTSRLQNQHFRLWQKDLSLPYHLTSHVKNSNKQCKIKWLLWHMLWDSKVPTYCLESGSETPWPWYWLPSLNSCSSNPKSPESELTPTPECTHTCPSLTFLAICPLEFFLVTSSDQAHCKRRSSISRYTWSGTADVLLFMIRGPLSERGPL